MRRKHHVVRGWGVNLEQAILARGFRRVDGQVDAVRFGLAAGVVHTAVYRWLAGELPRPDKLFQIADFLDVEPRWLITGQGPWRRPIITNDHQAAQRRPRGPARGAASAAPPMPEAAGTYGSAAPPDPLPVRKPGKKKPRVRLIGRESPALWWAA